MWRLLGGRRREELEAEGGREGITVSSEDETSSCPRMGWNMTESVSVSQLLADEGGLGLPPRLRKVGREERSESVREGAGDGGSGRPDWLRRRWRAAQRTSTSPPTVFSRTFSSRSFCCKERNIIEIIIYRLRHATVCFSPGDE